MRYVVKLWHIKPYTFLKKYLLSSNQIVLKILFFKCITSLKAIISLNIKNYVITDPFPQPFPQPL